MNIHPVDYFVEMKLNAAKFDLAQKADPRMLLRRATYDLIGLPPTPEETEQFLAAW